LCSLVACTWQTVQFHFIGGFGFVTGIVIPVSSHFSAGGALLGGRSCLIFRVDQEYVMWTIENKGEKLGVWCSFIRALASWLVKTVQNNLPEPEIWSDK
jgi:hypothetical protein